MQLAIFEDDNFENFYPLTLIRPIYELKCGPTMLHEKILRALKPTKTCYFARDYLTDVLKQRIPGAPVNDPQALTSDDVLLVNGSWLMTGDAPLTTEGPEEVGISEKDDTVLYVRLKKQTAQACAASDFSQFLQAALAKVTPRKKITADLLKYAWDILPHICPAIVDDFQKTGRSGIKGNIHKLSAILGDESQVYIAPTANVLPHVTIDVTAGPVTIEENTRIDPHTFIGGPAYIGPDCMILGAKIREGTVLGPVCRVAGEIEESIAHGYVNKMHDGFLGHAYTGEGINLGAGTTNSDIKNDFSPVKMYMNGKFQDTNQLKVGSLIGDYTKTSIDTMFNTGSSIGTLSVILGGDGVLPKFIPSFCWYINSKTTKGFGFTKLLEAACVQLSRRDRELTEAEITVLRIACDITKPERIACVKRDRKKN